MAKMSGYNDKTPSGYGVSRVQQYTPEQMKLFGEAFSHLGPDSYTARLAGGDQSLFEEMEAPAHRQFNEKMGGIASRFSGMGMGGRRSSGFQNETSSAASNFAQDLQAKRQELQRNAIRDLMGMSNDLLNQRPYETSLYEKQQKDSGWGGAIGAGIGGLGGFMVGGPMGAMAGAQMGYGIGSGGGGGGNSIGNWQSSFGKNQSGGY